MAGRAGSALTVRTLARLRGLVSGRNLRAAEARPPPLGRETTITLRLVRDGEEAVLARLAALSERPIPAGPALVAEVDSQVLAAQSLAGGEPLGDPFRNTIEVKALLALRAAQLDSAAWADGQASGPGRGLLARLDYGLEVPRPLVEPRQ